MVRFRDKDSQETYAFAAIDKQMKNNLILSRMGMVIPGRVWLAREWNGERV
jgi:hypothetical protein